MSDPHPHDEPQEPSVPPFSPSLEGPPSHQPNPIVNPLQDGTPPGKGVRRFLAVVLAVGALLILLAGALLLTGCLPSAMTEEGAPPTEQGLGGSGKLLERYEAAVDAGQYEEAYNLLDRRIRKRLTLEQFTADQEKLAEALGPRSRVVSETSGVTSSVFSNRTAERQRTVEHERATASYTYEFREDEGTWRITGLRVLQGETALVAYPPES